MDPKNQQQLSTLSFLLDIAVKKVFPQVKRIQSAVTDCGSISEYHFPFPIQEEFLSWIEREIKALIKSNFILEISEMVPTSAAGLFTYHDEPYLAHFCEEKPYLIPLVRLQEFVGIAPKRDMCLRGPLRFEIKVTIVKQEKDFVSLQLFAHEDKKGLKEISTKQKGSKAAEFWVDSLGLVADKELFTWTSQGMLALEGLENLVKNELSKTGFSFIRSVPFILQMEDFEVHQSLINQQDIVKIAEIKRFVNEDQEGHFGLKNPLHYSQDQFFIYGDAAIVAQEMISSLQRIEQILKILSFDPKWVVALPPNYTRKQRALLLETCEKAMVAFEIDEDREKAQIEAQVKNCFGAYETLGFIQVPQEIKGDVKRIKGSGFRLFQVKGSVLGVIEKALALYLEQNKGKLPLLPL